MQSIRIIRLAMVGAALAAASPLVAQQAGGGRQGPGHHGDRMLAGLNLTDAQKAQIKSIHAKYKAQLSGSQSAVKPDLAAARAARQRGDTAAARAAFEKARVAMQANRPVREREMAEVRNILTTEQRQTLDARRAQWKAKGMKHRGGAGRPQQQ
jgi:Spy/CpxP family protein refolding chaperone